MRIGELAEQTGMTRDAIRFYERIGLIRPERGPEGRHGYRRYNASSVRRLGLIKQAKALGFSLGEIQELLDAWANHSFRPDQKRAILADKIGVVDRKILELQELSSELKLALAGIRDECQSTGIVVVKDITATAPITGQ
ncbi:MerR family transcriptional regulator [Aquitalea sp. ASV11]|uniref:MerR family transcriptional regulator n=1 Tax=Aquitalea sp. ASV11 TaxID=2795103 RepID=UPI00351C881E